MRVDLFDYDLPPDHIALRPVEPRDAARLLVLRPQLDLSIEDRLVRDLPDLLAAGDVLAVNDTRVIKARLLGERLRGGYSARVEATLLHPEGPAQWWALARPSKRLKIGDHLRFAAAGENHLETLDAEILAKGGEGAILLYFGRTGKELDEQIERIGQIPLPPYIAARRPADPKDVEDYQTLFARRPGAVAAPTASLHFTESLKTALLKRGITIQAVTLHVGAGTFLPVKAVDTRDHQMHAEWGEVTQAAAETLNLARAAGRRIIAAGTTSLRILETAAGPDRKIRPFTGETSLFITPGYKFKAVDALLTNFHLPRSTLFMLAAAFSGLPALRATYEHAIKTNYRFYSYGDACLLFPAPESRA
ncbi:MAG TPA: tRNA preQ1(34) S-adenosylmethionine ribosyltransferase-isomerase QueA [Methylocella sp.]|nr:tRNA preQ1(34) S-adenosylmethionine ribosyltransferase-isomerase QueA [Methylocella sp.]